MSPAELSLRLRQQALVAEFGLFALRCGCLQQLLDEASRVAAEGVETQFAKVLSYRAETNDFLVMAGVGWHDGVVGIAPLGGGLDSPAGYALHTGQSIVSNNLGQEQRFRVPTLLAEHGISSAINVVINSAGDEPYGILEADSTRRHDFVTADIAFLQGLANALSAAIERVASDTARDQLLHDKDLLMREVHHRVKNSLQLVRTMLGLQSRGASDDTRVQLEAAASRIMSIAAVHQRLYEGGSVAEGDARVYLSGLLHDMRSLVERDGASRTITLQCGAIMLPADDLTPLGLIVSELVTNASKYGEGDIVVRIERHELSLVVTVEDGGTGFPPESEMTPGLGMRLVKALAKGTPATAMHIDRSVPHGRIVVNVAV